MEEKVKQALKNISYVSGIDIKLICKDDFGKIENTLNQAEENEKALKIIVEKKVNIYAIIQSCSLNNYHWLMDSYESDFINEEKYNLVKKVVEKYGN